MRYEERRLYLTWCRRSNSLKLNLTFTPILVSCLCISFAATWSQRTLDSTFGATSSFLILVWQSPYIPTIYATSVDNSIIFRLPLVRFPTWLQTCKTRNRTMKSATFIPLVFSSLKFSVCNGSKRSFVRESCCTSLPSNAKCLDGTKRSGPRGCCICAPRVGVQIQPADPPWLRLETSWRMNCVRFNMKKPSICQIAIMNWKRNQPPVCCGDHYPKR